MPLRGLCLRKSLFNPSPGLARAYHQRNCLKGTSVPYIDIALDSPRWLLLQAEPYSLGFFRRLRSGKLANPHEQVMDLFQKLVGLTYYYGYFRVTPRMVFIEGSTVQVWIHEDLFSLEPLFPEGTSTDGESSFVTSFLRILNDTWKDWDPASSIHTIDAVFNLLEMRLRVAKGSMTVGVSRGLAGRPD